MINYICWITLIIWYCEVFIRNITIYKHNRKWHHWHAMLCFLRQQQQKHIDSVPCVASESDAHNLAFPRHISMEGCYKNCLKVLILLYFPDIKPYCFNSIIAVGCKCLADGCFAILLIFSISLTWAVRWISRIAMPSLTGFWDMQSVWNMLIMVSILSGFWLLINWLFCWLQHDNEHSRWELGASFLCNILIRQCLCLISL